MKKIIATLTFILAITFGANAQDKKVSNEDLAKSDASALVDLLKLDETQTRDFTSLFQMKQEVLNNPEVSEERKKEMVRIIGLKIEASVDSKQLELLKSNKELYSKITGETAISAKK